MCDECGCRELMPVGTLARQHELLGDAAYRANKLAKNYDFQRSGRLLVAIAHVIIPHADVEEDNLFELFCDTSAEYGPTVSMLRGQHASIEQQLGRLVRNQTCDTPWVGDVERCITDIQTHFNDEYNDLFKDRGFLPDDPRLQIAEDELNLIDLDPLEALVRE